MIRVGNWQEMTVSFTDCLWTLILSHVITFRVDKRRGTRVSPLLVSYLASLVIKIIC